MTKMLTREPDSGGFVAIPRRTLDTLLSLQLTRRELSVLLLVARLTYGCRNASWVRLRQADLSAVGIGPGHAGETIAGLLARGLLERSGESTDYRIGTLKNRLDAGSQEREERLDRLVAAQLAGSYRNGKEGAPESGSSMLPEREQWHSQNGKASTVPIWQFDRSQGRFLMKEKDHIDI